MTASRPFLVRDARLIDADGERSESWLLVERGVVAGTGSGAAPEVPEAEVVDAAGAAVTPGLIDIHVHGGGGHAFDDGADAIVDGLALHRRHGTTRSLVSLVTAPLPQLEQRLGEVAAAVSRDAGVLGAHLEGPCISPHRRGAHDPAAIAEPDARIVDAVLAAGPDLVRQITIAPERAGGLDAIGRLADAGIRVAVGHTEADHHLARAAFDRGATLLTHAFNAMPGIAHRAPGPIVAALEDERVTLELILDGVHVHPGVAGMLLRAGGGRVALITDAMAAAGAGDGDYLLGSLAVTVREGRALLADGVTVAGSTLTLDRAVRMAIVEAGIAPAAAIGAATRTPALAVGEAHRGLLAEGAPADLVLWDEDWRARRVWVDGVAVAGVGTI